MNTKISSIIILIFGIIIILVNVDLQLYAQETGIYLPHKNIVPDGYKVVEGDIIVPVETSLDGTYATNLWTDGIVPYNFDANVSPENRNRALAAMAEWEAVANVQFVPFLNNEQQINFIHIQSSNVNSSYVGMINGGQELNIVSWGYKFIIVHELGHALGLWHEHTRGDRDDYVQIHTANIQPQSSHNFDLNTSAGIYPKQAYGLSDEMTYDFDSVMHYDQCAFSIGCPQGSSCVCHDSTRTIIVLPPNHAWQNSIGQIDHLSFLDQLTMASLYPENDHYFVDKTYNGIRLGTFLRPYNEFVAAINNANVSSGSTLMIQPAHYSATGIYTKPITLKAPLGNVSLGQ